MRQFRVKIEAFREPGSRQLQKGFIPIVYDREIDRCHYGDVFNSFSAAKEWAKRFIQKQQGKGQ